VDPRPTVPIDIEDELRSSYLDYSMSVIIGRALPDVRDGLKPVHRRILYAMFREGMRANKRYSKCAGVVGEVLKKYHPHGDSAVYDALVRMAQPWNMRSPLVDGQGNFGSVDGDPAAAYRYTECRLTRLAEALVSDQEIDKDTVPFVPNFDGAHEEPAVLPATFPNLLVNGSDGIAVGMATKIPPHNLGEIIDAVIALTHNPAIDVEELLRIVPGPDFPTAGHIYGREGVREAYATGRGRVVVRGNAFFEEMPNGRDAIIIDELPFQVNKARLVEDIANLVKERRIEGIAALRDESDRKGMRVVVEIKRDGHKEVILNQLFKHTALQSTFGVILLAIVHNRPQVLTLKEMLEHFLQHRRDVTVRRCRYELREAQERLHILEGLLRALDLIDAIIATIRASDSTEAAHTALVSDPFSFSDPQARAILEMRLQRLVGMERQKLEVEAAALRERIGWLEAVLGSELRLLEVIREELQAVRDTFANDRRTRFVENRGEIRVLDTIPDEDQIITVSMSGYLKRTAPAQYTAQRRGGVGKRGMRTRTEDSARTLFVANTHGDLLVFSHNGWVFKVPVWQVPVAGRDAIGTALANLVTLEDGDSLAGVLPVSDWAREGADLVFLSQRGVIKRTRLAEYQNIRTNGLRAYDCGEGDTLLTVIHAHSDQDLLILTSRGRSIRLPGTDRVVGDKEVRGIRHMGRVARGNRGIDLNAGDTCAAILAVDPGVDALLLTITAHGYGALTRLADYRLQNRGGQGIRNIRATPRNGAVVGGLVTTPGDLVLLLTDTGRVIKVRIAPEERVIGRGGQGKRWMRLESEDGTFTERIVGVAPVVDDDTSDIEVVEPEEAAADADDPSMSEGEE